MSKPHTEPSQKGPAHAAEQPETPRTGRNHVLETPAQNDRAASKQSGMGSNPSARDVTSGRSSGNQ